MSGDYYKVSLVLWCALLGIMNITAILAIISKGAKMWGNSNLFTWPRSTNWMQTDNIQKPIGYKLYDTCTCVDPICYKWQYSKMCCAKWALSVSNWLTHYCVTIVQPLHYTHNGNNQWCACLYIHSNKTKVTCPVHIHVACVELRTMKLKTNLVNLLHRSSAFPRSTPATLCPSLPGWFTATLGGTELGLERLVTALGYWTLGPFLHFLCFLATRLQCRAHLLTHSITDWTLWWWVQCRNWGDW